MRWAAIVGDDVAAHAEPLKIQWQKVPDGQKPPPGTLVLRVDGPAAIEIQHMSQVILERVNRYFGWRCVGRVTIRQGPVTKRRKAPAAPREPEATAMAEVARKIGPFEDEALGRSVARLGALVKGRVTRS